jgi:hypothetical protein
MFARLALMHRQAPRNAQQGHRSPDLSLRCSALLSIKILAVMLFFVVPRFAGMFEHPRGGAAVVNPGAARGGGIAAENPTGYPLTALTVAAGVGGPYFSPSRTDRGRQFDEQPADPHPRRRPVSMSRLIQAQTFRILGMLLEARVGLLEALGAGAPRHPQRPLPGALRGACEDSVTRGESISGRRWSGDGPVSPVDRAGGAHRRAERASSARRSPTSPTCSTRRILGDPLDGTTKLVEPLVLIVMGHHRGIPWRSPCSCRSST